MFLQSLHKRKDSNAIAAHDGSGSISHKTLFKRSEAVALFLLETLGNEKQPVIICGDKENDMLVCIFGILKAGMPYVVVPSYYPKQRMDSIFSDCDARICFNIADIPLEYENISIKTSKDITDFVQKYDGKTVSEDNYVSGDDDISLIYTSGSTGVPKGVRISHNNVVSRIKQMSELILPALPKTGEIRTVMFSSLAFSASFYNLYCMFASCGVSLYNVPKSTIHEHALLLEYLLKVQPHTMAGTPSMFRRLLLTEEFREENFPSLCAVTLGGEPFTSELAKLFKERFPRLHIVNIYGMTEAASGPMACVITDEIIKNNEGALPVGLPLEGCDAYITDDNGNVLEGDNIIGELVIAGVCVTNGYYKRSELTNAYYFTNENGRRAYKTRDLVYRKNGLYYFSGRKDNRVKIGGNRIELEDVEANMKQLDIVADCAVTVCEKGGTASLVAYVIKSDSSVKDMAAMLAIKKSLKERVESHMIPQKIVFAAELPKNINMKTDRVLLKKMANED